MINNVLTELSEKLFDLFVVNDKSVAYQVEDGSYRRRDVPVTPFVIEAMIRQRGSLGCYQQQFGTGCIRWICLDFDCANKENPDVASLGKSVVHPLVTMLGERGIRYLTEFSGRRGIHVWITFSQVISKGEGYAMLLEIERLLREKVGDFEEGGWKLDRFPATGTSANNVVGKQVKIPLSTHKAGTSSYFYEGVVPTNSAQSFDAFIIDQKEILDRYRENDPSEVMRTLGISRTTSLFPAEVVYRRYPLVEHTDITAAECVRDLSELAVYRALFTRLMRGMADYRDRAVLYGSLSCVSSGRMLLKEILSLYPGYDAEKTDIHVSELQGRYYPATLGYLYSLYGMRPEDGLDLGQTGLDYLLGKRGVQLKPMKLVAPSSEKAALLQVSETVRKEIRYLASNDEVSDVGIQNDLRLMNEGECELLSREIGRIVRGEASGACPKGHRVFKRLEKRGKARELVSLSAHDRVLTTHLALKLCSAAGMRWDSFSYHIDFMSRADLFERWYYSWKNYRAHIRPFLDLPFFGDYTAFVVDLQGFYDHVDMLVVYRSLLDELPDEECSNMFRYLVEFNDSLMSGLYGGSRIGVPQGPAYARIIAEIHLDRVLRSVVSRAGGDGVHAYRYVDDMVFFCEPGIDAACAFDAICLGLENCGLPINRDKSQCFGAISELAESDKAVIAHEDSFSYAIHENDYTGQLTLRERRSKVDEYLEANEFGMDALGFIFGTKTVPEAKERCFRDYRTMILASERGRGSHFKLFYQYLLSDVGRLGTVLEEGGLSLIPEGSINFSNFVNELYLAYKRKDAAACNLLGRIVEERLLSVDYSELDEADANTVKALILIADGRCVA